MDDVNGAADPESSQRGDAQESLCEEGEQALRRAVQVLLIALGDLNRFEMSLADSVSVGGGDWSAALSYYEKAARVAPFDGSVSRPLASAARASGDVFGAGYHLARSMITSTPYPPAREAMLELFEAQRIVADQYDNVTALSRLSLPEHLDRFKCHFLAAAGIAFSRTGADRFQFHSEKCRRHLGTLLQLLTVESIRDTGQGLGSKGDFRVFGQSADEDGGSSRGKESSSDRKHQLRLSHLIDGVLSQAILICLSLLSSVAEKNGLVEIGAAVDWDKAYGGQDVSSLSAEEKIVCEKRYGIQSLHKVQVIPGLIDMGRLLLGLVATLVSAEGVGVGGTVPSGGVAGKGESSQAQTRIAATARSLGLFLDWLDGNPEFCILSVLDREAWEQMESDLPAYVSALAPLTAARAVEMARRAEGDQTVHVSVPLSACLIAEDFETAGLLPFESTLRRRQEKFSEIYGVYQMTSVDSDSVVDNALQFFDPSWLSVCALRCSSRLRKLCGTPICLGDKHLGGMYFNRNRQIMWPSTNNVLTDAANRLPVIVYKASSVMRYTGFTSSGFQAVAQRVHILSEEEFMRGEVSIAKPPTESVEENIPSDDKVDAGGDISDLSEEEEEGEGGAVEVDTVAGGGAVEVDAVTGGEAGGEEESGTGQVAENQGTLTSMSTRDMLAAKCAALLQGSRPSPTDLASTGAENVSRSEVEETGLEQVGGEGKGVSCSVGPSKGLLRVADMKSVIPGPTSSRKGETDRRAGNVTPRKPAAAAGRGGRGTNGLSKRANGELPLIVIDAPNVAMRHGINAKFSCKGIKLAIDFFHSAGHRVVSFLPVTWRLNSSPAMIKFSCNISTFLMHSDVSRTTILTSRGWEN